MDDIIEIATTTKDDSTFLLGLVTLFSSYSYLYYEYVENLSFDVSCVVVTREILNQNIIFDVMCNINFYDRIPKMCFLISEFNTTNAAMVFCRSFNMDSEVKNHEEGYLLFT